MGRPASVLLLALAAMAPLVGAMHSQVQREIDANNLARPQPAHGYNKSAPGEVFFVHSASRGGATVRLPWMKFFWANNRLDILAFKAAYRYHLSESAGTP